MSEEDLSTVTLGELIARVGGVINGDETVTFGSPMAVRTMLDMLARHYALQVDAYADDCRNAVDIAKSHIADVNVELAGLKVERATLLKLVDRLEARLAAAEAGWMSMVTSYAAVLDMLTSEQLLEHLSGNGSGGAHDTPGVH